MFSFRCYGVLDASWHDHDVLTTTTFPGSKSAATGPHVTRMDSKPAAPGPLWLELQNQVLRALVMPNLVSNGRWMRHCCSVNASHVCGAQSALSLALSFRLSAQLAPILTAHGLLRSVYSCTASFFLKAKDSPVVKMAVPTVP